MSTLKRTASQDREQSISPPPTKRKLQSTINKNAVASFFTPASKKPQDRTLWTERGASSNSPATLLIGRYEPENYHRDDDDGVSSKRRKIAAFDFDQTLVEPSSGRKHGNGAHDWKWWDLAVPTKLRALYHEEGYHVVIISNQAGLPLHPDPSAKAPKKHSDRIVAFKHKVNTILTQLDIPIALYAATGKDIFRKPRIGIWTEICRDFCLNERDVDKTRSILVGDAAGRVARNRAKDGKMMAKDFSCSDRNFAHNAGIQFKTPEEFFLNEPPCPFQRDFDMIDFPYVASDTTAPAVCLKRNDIELLLICGSPGSGKSTFFWKHLEPLAYERVNQDILKTRDACIKAARSFLSEGRAVAIDNTNADRATRAVWIELARRCNVPIRCIWLKTSAIIAEHNDAVRSLNEVMNPESRTILPKLAFAGFAKRFEQPKVVEGFQELVEVDFMFAGTAEEYAVWARYWT